MEEQITPTSGQRRGPLARAPLPYEPSFEIEEANESETIQELVMTLNKIEDIVFKHSGHAERSVHAKSHGLLNGTLTVVSDLPDELRQGLFAQTRDYPVVVRFSTSPGDLLSDAVSTPRGVAIKVLDVSGDRLAGDNELATQDFLMVDGPAFLAPGPGTFLSSLKALAATTDKVPSLKRALSAVLRGAEHVVEAAGGKSPTLMSLGGHPLTSLLRETFSRKRLSCLVRTWRSCRSRLHRPICSRSKTNGWTCTKTTMRSAPTSWISSEPTRRSGNFAYSFAPIGKKCRSKTPAKSGPKARARSGSSRCCASVRKPRGRRSAPELIDDGMSFSPWHCLAAHRPLGSVMRARKVAYRASAEHRFALNRCPFHQPAPFQGE